MKIYAAMINPCIYESEYKILSLHKTRAGADTAVDAAKAEKLQFYRTKVPEYMNFKVEVFDLKD